MKALLKLPVRKKKKRIEKKKKKKIKKMQKNYGTGIVTVSVRGSSCCFYGIKKKDF